MPQNLVHAHAAYRKGVYCLDSSSILTCQNHSSSPYKKSVGHPPCSPKSPAYEAGDRRNSWFGALRGRKSIQKLERPILLSHSTTALHHVTGRVGWHRRPAFPEYADAPHPQGRDDTAESFFEWLVLHQLNDVFCGVGASNLIGSKEKM